MINYERIFGWTPPLIEGGVTMVSGNVCAVFNPTAPGFYEIHIGFDKTVKSDKSWLFHCKDILDNFYEDATTIFGHIRSENKAAQMVAVKCGFKFRHTDDFGFGEIRVYALDVKPKE